MIVKMKLMSKVKAGLRIVPSRRRVQCVWQAGN